MNAFVASLDESRWCRLCLLIYATHSSTDYRRFKQWASFGPFNLTSPNANSAAWIVKQGPEGEYLWAETIIIAESANAEAHALTTDKDGNIYLVSRVIISKGLLKCSFPFNLTHNSFSKLPLQAIGASGQTTVGGMSINVPAQGPSQFSSIGQLVAKLNPSGQAVWLEAFGGKCTRCRIPIWCIICSPHAHDPARLV